MIYDWDFGVRLTTLLGILYKFITIPWLKYTSFLPRHSAQPNSLHSHQSLYKALSKSFSEPFSKPPSSPIFTTSHTSPPTISTHKQVPISIHIFAWKREKSLKRLLQSLSKANYHDYNVPLFFHIDGDPLDLVVNLATAFVWPHGEKHLHLREGHLGMPEAIVSAWLPKSDQEYGIFLEDDVEVSPYFFDWVVYCTSFMSLTEFFDKDSGLIGASFYTPKVNEIGPAPNPWSPPPWNPTKVVGNAPVFYFQLPCSWGAIYKAKYWRDFVQYYSYRIKVDQFPDTPNSRSSEWFSSWKRMLIELMLLKGWYLLYPNFPNFASFSTNYFELGVHSVPEGIDPVFTNNIRKHGDRRFTVPLIKNGDFKSKLPSLTSPALIASLPIVNLQHERVQSKEELRIDKRVFLRNYFPEELQSYLAQV